ncbi:hypothetical protein Tco_1125405, partial [Tanacetum coccineum]
LFKACVCGSHDAFCYMRRSSLKVGPLGSVMLSRLVPAAVVVATLCAYGNAPGNDPAATAEWLPV